MMHVTALRAVGFRNLDTTVELCDPLAVLVGENNAGKSNVIDALRTVLEPGREQRIGEVKLATVVAAAPESLADRV